MMKNVENILVKMSETKWNYWFGFVYDGVIAIGLTFMAYMLGANNTDIIRFFIFGVLFFTLVEYVVHAHIFHGPFPAFVKAHVQHHKHPLRYDAMPFFFAQIIISPVYIVAILLFSFELASVFTSGILIGYIIYGLAHHAMHRVKPKNRYFKYMIDFHDIHHANPKMNHGVTVPIWDMIFGTYQPIKK